MIETNYPDDTTVFVHVSRMYRESDRDETYSHDFWFEKSTVGEWRNRLERVVLDHENWRKSLERSLTKLERYIGKTSVASVSQEIEVSVTVPGQTGVDWLDAGNEKKVFLLDAKGSLIGSVPDDEVVAREKIEKQRATEDSEKIKYLQLGERPGLMVANAPVTFELAVDPFSVPKRGRVQETISRLEAEDSIVSVTIQPDGRGTVAVVVVNPNWNDLTEGEKSKLADIADRCFHDFRFTDSAGRNVASQTVVGPAVNFFSRASNTKP